MPLRNLRLERDAKQEPRRDAPEALKRSALRADVTCRVSLVTPAFILLFPSFPVNWPLGCPGPGSWSVFYDYSVVDFSVRGLENLVLSQHFIFHAASPPTTDHRMANTTFQNVKGTRMLPSLLEQYTGPYNAK